MNKRDDRIDDEMAYIFNDYLTDVEDLESAFITEKDIVKMILVEYHALGLSIDEISKAWGYTKQEILDLIKNNPVSEDELNEFVEELYDPVSEDELIQSVVEGYELGISIEDIAKEWEVPEEAIIQILINNGIEIKERE